jgi:hypothetical protein
LITQGDLRIIQQIRDDKKNIDNLNINNETDMREFITSCREKKDYFGPEHGKPYFSLVLKYLCSVVNEKKKIKKQVELMKQLNLMLLNFFKGIPQLHTELFENIMKNSIQIFKNRIHIIWMEWGIRCIELGFINEEDRRIFYRICYKELKNIFRDAFLTGNELSGSFETYIFVTLRQSIGLALFKNEHNANKQELISEIDSKKEAINRLKSEIDENLSQYCLESEIDENSQSRDIRSALNELLNVEFETENRTNTRRHRMLSSASDYTNLN